MSVARVLWAETLWALPTGGLDGLEACTSVGFSVHAVGIAYKAFVMASVISHLMRG